MRPLLQSTSCILMIAVLQVGIVAQQKTDSASKKPQTTKQRKDVAPVKTNNPLDQDPTLLEALNLLNDLIASTNGIKNDYLRIRMQAEIADGLWVWDQPRAQALFEKAIEELKIKSDVGTAETLVQFSPKFQLLNDILKLISSHDRELAARLLESVQQTKTDRKPESGEAPKQTSNNPANLAALYLRLASFSIDSDIQRAAQLTRTSIQIGLTPYLAETLERIRLRNQTLADDLCFTALGTLSENKDAGTTFVNYLGPYVFPGFGQSAAVTPARNPVLAKFFLNQAFAAIIRQQLPAPPNGTYHELVINYMTVKALAPHFNQYLPDKSGTITNEINRRAVLLNRNELEAVNTYSDSNDVKELLKSSENTQNKNLKDSILAKAALLASEAGNVEEALSSADKIADDDVKRGVRTMVLHRATMTAIREGEFEKAYQYAKDLDALVQRTALFAQLARAFAQRKKDLGRAVELLTEIKNAVDSGHEDANQRVRSALTITNAMAHINPELSFEFMAFAVKLMNSTNLDFEQLTGPGTDALQPKDTELVNASLGLNQFLLGESFSQLAHQNYQQAMALALSIENKEGAALSKLAIAKRTLADAYSMKTARRNEEPGKQKVESEQLSSPARSLIKQLAAEEYDRAVERFDSNLKMTMPAHVLQDRWRTLLAEVGAFKRTISATPGSTHGYEVVTVKCEFDEGLLDVRVVFDKKKQVTGLFFIYPSQ